MKKGWEIKTLGEICEVLDSKRKPITKRDRTAGEYPYYGATGILDYVHEYIFDEKLVLIGEDGAKWESGEWTAFIAEGKYWVNNHAHVIRPNRSIVLDNWIVYFLYFSDLHKYVTGLTVPKLNQEKMRSITLPIPPLPEQQQIVSVLDEAFASIAQAKSNAERNLVNARELFESLSKEVFDTNGKGWEEKKLGDKDIIEIIDNDRGVNYPKKSDFHPEGYCLFMNTKNVRPDGFEFTITMFITEKKDKALGKGKLSRNDVVMTTRGTIGNLGVYNDEVPFEHIRTNSGMLIFRPNTKHILPEYLFEALRSGLIKSQIRKHVSGAAQPQLPIKTLVNFTFHLPKSLAEQRAIVGRLEALSAETKRLEEIYQEKIESLEEFKKSVLSKAFGGEI